MLFYNLGCNFDEQLPDRVAELNSKFKNANVKINELYGSDQRHSYLTARPDFRLPDISQEYFEGFVSRCTQYNIEFNYTLNTIYPGSKKFLTERRTEIIEFIKYLEAIGVKRITIANPILLDFTREASSTIDIEISTIMHIDTVSQIRYLKEHYSIDKVCSNLLRNRNIKFLRAATSYCNRNGVKLELIVNEFCGVGNEEYSTHCVFRDSCYLTHSSDVTKEDALSLNGYPMQHCMTSRNTDPVSWLRLLFIRPEDVNKYAKLGITNFKITGRTGTTEYLLRIAEAYMSKHWSSNLLSLWKPLETIYNGQKEFDFKYNFEIKNGALNGFIDHWFNNEDFLCENEDCGFTCHYCHNFFKRQC